MQYFDLRNIVDHGGQYQKILQYISETSIISLRHSIKYKNSNNSTIILIALSPPPIHCTMIFRNSIESLAMEAKIS